jgi:hypothetical protein
MPKFILDALQDGLVTLAVPHSNYKNSFQLAGGSLPAPGQKVKGTIHAPAWKAEAVELGGNYVEPLYGRPRRMQGTILSVNAAANELTVQVGYEVTVKLPEKYKAADYQVGSRIGWDNVEIPTFTPEA